MTLSKVRYLLYMAVPVLGGILEEKQWLVDQRREMLTNRECPSHYSSNSDFIFDSMPNARAIQALSTSKTLKVEIVRYVLTLETPQNSTSSSPKIKILY
jgi:hypothetical protein